MLLEEQRIRDCLEGAPGAWDQLYDAYHGRLVQSIRRLAGALADGDLIDEIAARVWYALVRGDFALLARFDMHRGCQFPTYLSGIARKEMAAYFRSERRRKVRERVVAEDAVRITLDNLPRTREDLREFLALLSPRERAYCLQTLLSKSEAVPPEERIAHLSEPNKRQLRHRIRRKLEQFLKQQES